MTESDENATALPASGKPSDEAFSKHKVDPKLLELLACPLTKGPLDYKADSQELISWKAEVAFPIRDGVPLMTPEVARPLTEAELAKRKARKS